MDEEDKKKEAEYLKVLILAAGSVKKKKVKNKHNFYSDMCEREQKKLQKYLKKKGIWYGFILVGCPITKEKYIKEYYSKNSDSDAPSDTI